MGLITKEIEVGLGGTNIKHYESLGYKIPRRINKRGELCYPSGSKIVVKVDDLPESSNVLVNIKYDCCGKISDMPYYAYKRNNHDGKIYCMHCNNSIFLSGENNPSYNKNKTDEERQKERAYKEYADFVKRVLARDNYICQCCNKPCYDKAEVHHLDGYNWCIEGRCDDTNGITLCHNCHGNFHSIYGYGDNTRGQFEEWFGKSVDLTKYEQELCPARMFYCFEDDMVYVSVHTYAKQNNYSKDNIYSVCNKRTKTAYGKHYVWYEDYLLMTDKEKEEYIKGKSNVARNPIICVTTGVYFINNTVAGNYYNISKASNIGKCCRGERKSTGKLPDGTPLVWMYYEDFLKLPQEEQNEILARNKESSNDGSF